eukprot:5414379-Prymnesium_polylepis.1
MTGRVSVGRGEEQGHGLARVWGIVCGEPNKVSPAVVMLFALAIAEMDGHVTGNQPGDGGGGH